jgi:hypothetical protein
VGEGRLTNLSLSVSLHKEIYSFGRKYNVGHNVDASPLKKKIWNFENTVHMDHNRGI